MVQSLNLSNHLHGVILSLRFESLVAPPWMMSLSKVIRCLPWVTLLAYIISIDGKVQNFICQLTETVDSFQSSSLLHTPIPISIYWSFLIIPIVYLIFSSSYYCLTYFPHLSGFLSIFLKKWKLQKEGISV